MVITYRTFKSFLLGIEPSVDFVKRAGIVCGRGVKVDDIMRTNMPDIYAAGDLIETFDPLTSHTRVIGQWYPSIQQARTAAYSMLDLLDTSHPFRFDNFYNATFLYGLDFASVGLSNIPKGGKGYQELVADPEPRTYKKVILKDGVPVGMLALGNRSSMLAFKRAIDHGVNLSPVTARLLAPDFTLNQWLDELGVSAPILGVSREGAVATKKAAYALQGEHSAILTLNMLTEAALVLVTDSDKQFAQRETYLSQTKVVTIGRQDGADLVIKHDSISRRHAEISYANGHYVLLDLASKNGSFVNKVRLEQGSVHILQPGDQVLLGKVAFVLQTRQIDASSSVLLKRHKEPEYPTLEVPARRSTCRECSATSPYTARFCTVCGTSLNK